MNLRRGRALVVAMAHAPALLVALCAFLSCARPASADPLADAVRVMNATPVQAGRIDLAVHMETQGHFTLANRKAERFTASTVAKAGELERAVATLAPETKTGARETFHLTTSTLYAAVNIGGNFGPLYDLRRDDQLRMRVVIGDRSYPTWGWLLSTATHFGPLVSITPTLTLQARTADDFISAHRMLTRPLSRSELRVIALKKGAPRVLSALPRIDPSSGAALVDEIEPSAAVDVVRAAKRETLVFTGDLATLGVDWWNLQRLTQGHDVTLVHVETGSTAQPGGRNFLWLPVRTPALKLNSEQITLVDLIALSTGNRPAELRPTLDDSRMLLSARFGIGSAGQRTTTGRWLDTLIEVTGDMLGRAPPRRIEISLPLPTRQAELDRRLIKALPSWLQFGYGGLLLLGLVGLPTAWRWFARVWPQEQSADYAVAMGWHAARAVRAAVFAVVFMPLAAIVAAPAQLLRLVRRPA